MRIGVLLGAMAMVLSAAQVLVADEYVVTMDNPNSEVIHVDATLRLRSDMIGMYITRSPELPNGTADLVDVLKITDDGGKELAWEAIPGGDWKLQDVSEGQEIHLSYDVELRHGEYNWGPGIDEVAYTNNDGVFFVGQALFIMAHQQRPTNISIKFLVPEGWRVSAPWEKTTEGYIAKDMRGLLRNCFFLGTHIEETVTVGEFTLVMAFANDLKDAKQLFVNTMKPLLPAYVDTFGGMPSKSKYLVVINRGNRADGGAFSDSYSLLTLGPVDETSSVIWGHGMAHELFHFWNAHTIAPLSPADAEWFKEGFTDYYTIVHRSRAGLDPPKNTFRKLENTMRRFAVARIMMGLDDTLEEAGSDKHKKRFIVYGGGTLVALALDVRIRQATENQRSLDDLMREMYSEFANTGKRYTINDITRLASKVAGEDLTEFIEASVKGTGMIDVVPALTAMGLRVDTFIDEFYISTNEKATKQQKAMRKSLLGI